MTQQHIKQNRKLEDNLSSKRPLKTTLLGPYSPVFNFFSPLNKHDTLVSDSPGQTMETKEIVNPLDMEQVDMRSLPKLLNQLTEQFIQIEWFK